MMKANSFFVYTNLDELDRFLVANTIYPGNGGSSLSLSKKGHIYLTKRRLSKEAIFQTCNFGLNTPVVLEVAIKLPSGSGYVELSPSDILLTRPLTCNSITAIFNLAGEMPFVPLKDRYLFRSLLSGEPFDYGEDAPPDLASLPERGFDGQEVRKWDRIQGFYACRYSTFSSVVKAGKNTLLFSNIDSPTAKELFDLDLNGYFASVFSKSKVRFPESTIAVPDAVVFFEENHERLLKGKKVKDKDGDAALFSCLLGACLAYDEGGSLEVSDIEFASKAKEADDIAKSLGGNIFALKQKLFGECDPFVRVLFLLNEIIQKDYDDALDYLSNFDGLISGGERKCLMSLFGLCKGLSKLTLAIKQRRADLLLFAYNKAKPYFPKSVESAVGAKEYFSRRGILVDNLVSGGLNVIAYNRDYELKYLNTLIAGEIAAKWGLPKNMVASAPIKFTTAEELHATYLRVKRGGK